MYIYCIEGCHGCGKTEIVTNLKNAGYNILDEGFLDMPVYDNLAPQSFTVELLWVARWIERVLKIAQTAPSHSVYFADRSPYSAMLYAPNGVLLKPIIYEMMRDLATAGINVINIFIDVEPDVLWERIVNRLKAEPAREKYNEGSRDHMNRVIAFYKSHDDLWKHRVNNTTLVPIDLILSTAGIRTGVNK